MSINRNNYEEYFILYMDNELSPPERRMVEAFLNQHPDLKEELDLLLQYKLVPDEDIVFERKEELMVALNDRTATITETNYQDWLILYLDNELNFSEKNAVDAFIQSHPAAKKEWEILSLTKLQPEEIVFRNKSSLYRTEKAKPIRLFNDRRWRAAAAILLLLVVGVTTAILVNRKSDKPAIVNIKPSEKKTETAITKPNPVLPENKIQVVKETDKPVQPIEIKNINPNNVAKNQPLIKPENKKLLPEDAVVNATVKNTNEKFDNNLPQPVNNANLKKIDKNDAIASNNNRIESIRDNPLTNEKVTKLRDDPSDYTQAVVLEQPDGKKNKLRGFFRKVTRTFEKRTNMDASDNDDKLLLAGLAIKLK